MNCDPLFNYGTASGTWSYKGEGYDAMTVAPAEGDVRLELAGSIQLGVLGARSYGRTTLTQGQSAFVVLSWGDAKVPASLEEASAALNTTVGFWRDWLATAKIPDHPWKPYLDRSALTLKALSYKPTGAIMAAATTSLPETPGGARNWDYRFTWIRDSSFTLRALYRLGFGWEAIEYFGFRSGADPGEGRLRCSDGLTPGPAAQSRHKIAIGLTGEPVARASRSGAITHRNDHRLNSAHSGARAENSR